MVMVQLSKPWKSKVRTVNNFRVLARLPLGELGSASQTLCTCTLAGLGVASVLKGTHRAGEATGCREASNKGAGHPRPGDVSLSPAPARPAEGRGPKGPGPIARPGQGPVPPEAGSGGGRAVTSRRHYRRPSRETPTRTVPRLAARPRRGRGRCYLPRALPLPAGAALLATAAAARRPPAEGLVTATSVHRARPRRRRRRRPRSPPPAATRRPLLVGAAAPSCGRSWRWRREQAFATSQRKPPFDGPGN